MYTIRHLYSTTHALVHTSSKDTTQPLPAGAAAGEIPARHCRLRGARDPARRASAVARGAVRVDPSLAYRARELLCFIMALRKLGPIRNNAL